MKISRAAIYLFLCVCAALFWGWFTWRINASPSAILNWDVYQHWALGRLVAQHGWSFLPTNLSDAFTLNAYTPLFSVALYGWSQLWLTLLPFARSLYMLEVIGYAASVGLMCWLTWLMTKRRDVTAMTGVIGAFALEPLLVEGGFILLPQGVAAMLVVAAIIAKLHNRRILFSLCILLSIATHYFIGGFGLLVVGVWLASRKLLTEATFVSQRKRFFLFIGLLIGLTILANAFITFDPFNTIESRAFSFSIATKLSELFNWYGALWILGIVAMIHSLRRFNKLTIWSLVTVIQLLIIGAPFAYSLRFYALTRYFFIPLIAYGLVLMVERFSIRWLKLPAYIAIASLMALQLDYNQYHFKQAYAYQNGYTSASTGEFEAAEYLSSHYSNSNAVLLISDSGTQHIMEGLSGINTPGGGVSTSEARSLVDNAFPLTTPDAVAADLLAVRDRITATPPTTVLYAISGRFMAWQRLPDQLRHDTTIHIVGPRDLSPDGVEYAQLLSASGRFKRVFSNRSMVIFEIVPSSVE